MEYEKLGESCKKLRERNHGYKLILKLPSEARYMVYHTASAHEFDRRVAAEAVFSIVR